MADGKQHLNGAYYGPSIPPSRSYHSYGRRGGGCGCGCLCWLLGLLVKLIIFIIVLVGIAALVFWLLFRPNMLKFHVTDASLNEFNQSSNGYLNYNLSLTVTIRNPNKHIGIYYDRIEANGYYADQRFTTITLEPFYQGHKNTTTLEPVFQGQSLVVLSSAAATEYNNEKSAGVFDVTMKLRLKVRFKLRSIKTNTFKPKIDCDLKLPMNSAASAAAYQSSKCHLDYNFW